MYVERQLHLGWRRFCSGGKCGQLTHCQLERRQDGRDRGPPGLGHVLAVRVRDFAQQAVRP